MSPNANARALYRQYRKSALKRGHLFEITFKVFYDVSQHNCYLCGVPPSQYYCHDNTRRNPFTYNGVDRVDNDIGYVEGNLSAACGTCNRLKHKRSLEDFLLYIRRAYEYNFISNSEDKDI